MRKSYKFTLRNQKNFSAVYNRGKSKGSKYVVVLYRKNNLDLTRIAYVASKKVGNSVQRNRSRPAAVNRAAVCRRIKGNCIASFIMRIKRDITLNVPVT